MHPESSFDIVLLPTYAQALERRKRAALCRGSAGGEGGAGGLFGVEVTSFDAWVGDLWELYGDGRALVAPHERLLAVSKAFEGADAGTLPASDGAALMAARCLRDASGLCEFEVALGAALEGRELEGAAAGLLAPAERELVSVMAKARATLHGAGLIEPGEALALLPAAMECAPARRLLAEGISPLTLQQRRFLDACPQIRVTERPAPGAQGVLPPPAGVDLRFAFPSGRYAKPLLLADIVTGLQGSGRAVIACKDPMATYLDLAPALARAGMACDLRARVRFCSTDVGRVFFAMRRLATEPSPDPADVTDVLYSPVTGASQSAARKEDCELRGDRLSSVTQACALLGAQSEVFSYWQELALDAGAHVLVGALEDAVRELPGVSEAYRREQLGALSALRDALGAACRLGAGMAACEAALRQAKVDVSRSRAAQTPGEGRPDASVLVCDHATAAALGEGSCATLVLADMERESQPVAEREDAGDALLAKLGILPADTALARVRRQFCTLEQVPSRTLVVERCLFDADAEPTGPAMVVEELVDCYRSDPSATDDIDNPYALPQQLQQGMWQHGEELLYGNAAVAHGSQPVAARIPTPEMGAVSAARRPLVLLPRAGKGGAADSRPRLSASQIESYLACPYLWFVHRRLRLEAPDEEFGPLQMGDFAHHALEAFYTSFQQQTGSRKVTPELLGEARALMAEVLDAAEARQYQLNPSDNRLVPCTELEHREVGELKGRIMDYLSFEAELLPGFAPAYFELEVGAQGDVEYAGAGLTGKIDRIDVDGRGRAVVIDYKGSVSEAHELAGEGRDVPAKVQALVYAQVVRRVLGLEVVGALYVSYGKRRRLAGAYDARALETAHLPAMRHDRCRYVAAEGGSFTDVLDQTEERAAQAVGRLLAGEVAPAPADAGACAWCPVSSCSQRRA